MLSQIDVDKLVKEMSLNDSGNKGLKHKSSTSNNGASKNKVCYNSIFHLVRLMEFFFAFICNKSIFSVYHDFFYYFQVRKFEVLGNYNQKDKNEKLLVIKNMV